MKPLFISATILGMLLISSSITLADSGFILWESRSTSFKDGISSKPEWKFSSAMETLKQCSRVQRKKFRNASELSSRTKMFGEEGKSLQTILDEDESLVLYRNYKNNKTRLVHTVQFWCLPVGLDPREQS